MGSRDLHTPAILFWCPGCALEKLEAQEMGTPGPWDGLGRQVSPSSTTHLSYSCVLGHSFWNLSDGHVFIMFMRQLSVGPQTSSKLAGWMLRVKSLKLQAGILESPFLSAWCQLPGNVASWRLGDGSEVGFLSPMGAPGSQFQLCAALAIESMWAVRTLMLTAGVSM